MNPASSLAARVGLRLAEIREERGLTQEAAAELLGMPKTNLHRYEVAALAMTLRTLERFCKGYGVEPTALFSPPTTTKRGRGRPRRTS